MLHAHSDVGHPAHPPLGVSDRTAAVIKGFELGLIRVTPQDGVQGGPASAS